MWLPQNADAIGKLILRLSVGGMMLLHGLHKMTHGVGGIMGLFASKGIPGFFAYFAYVGEVIAPILILIGFYTRLSALVLGGTIVVAILTAHGGDIFSLNSRTGAWGIELQMFYVFGAAAIFLLGAGKYSMDAKKGR
ncbi:MAG: DoxX family protein [Campylobacterales bacterium]